VTPERAVLLDLDGTLIDTPAAILAALHEACAPHGGAPDDARSLIGRPLDDILSVVLPGRGERVRHEAKAHFRSAFARRTLPVAPSLVFPGVPELLAGLAAEGVALAVVTCKVTSSARELTDAAGLSRHVDVLVGRDMTAVGKPAPDPALAAATLLGLAPQACTVVGDSVDDVAMALAAGSGVVAVTWGVASADALASAGAHSVVDSVSDLTARLRDPVRPPAQETTP
jgi:HAD superfamily hydrolase (TIGR01509 family)